MGTNSQELNPKYGGRNVVAAHGVVNGFFQRHFEVGADGATVSAMAIDGVDLTAQDLADLGFDQPLAAGQVPYTVERGRAITKIQFSAGGAFMFWLSEKKQNQIILTAAKIVADPEPLPNGFLEVLSDNEVHTKLVDGTNVGSFPIYYQDRPRETGKFVKVQFEIEASENVYAPVYAISVNRDGTNSAGNAQGEIRPEKRKKRFISGRIISANPADNGDSVGIAIENFNDTIEPLIDITKIEFTDLNDPIESVGVGQSFDGEPFEPDTSLIDANHVIQYDKVAKRLRVVASGAGTSRFTWKRPLLKNWSDNTGQAYIQLGAITAAGAAITAVKQGGAAWFTLGLTPITDEVYIDLTQNGMTVNADDEEFGIQIVTTGAGNVEIQKFSFVTGNTIVEILD